MFDLSSRFNQFYRDYVVLPSSKLKKLYTQKNLNIERLKSGLEEYNYEKGTCYSLAETRVQGSVAMATVVQNEENDYDIDVAIIFDKENLGDIGPLVARRIVAEALEKKTANFKNSPEIKTNCVRLVYSDGYHIDFAIYRRYKINPYETSYHYEHAGTTWENRDPKAITDWFQKQDKIKDNNLRKIVRLSKMFCKCDNLYKNLPGGLIQSVLCDEVFSTSYNRIDEIFYNTMCNVKNKLCINKEVKNPTDTTISIVPAQNHKQKVENFYNLLNIKLPILDVLFDSNCTEEKAILAWSKFFNGHSYWKDLSNSISKSICEGVELFSADSRNMLFPINSYYGSPKDTEQFIEDRVIYNDTYNVGIECFVTADGFRKYKLNEFLDKFPQFKKRLPHGLKLFFEAKTNTPQPHEIWWKIRNVGQRAVERNQIRGNIDTKRGKSIEEHSDFAGPHFVECYVIKNNECVAWDRIDVPIGEDII